MYQHHAKMPVPCATISGEGVRGVMFHPTMFPIGFGLSSFVEREGDDPSIIIDGEGEAMIELIDGTRTQVTKNIIVRLRMAGAARRPEDVTNMLALFSTHMPLPPRAGSKNRVTLHVSFPCGTHVELADGAFVIDNNAEPILDKSTGEYSFVMRFSHAREIHPDVYKAIAAKPFDTDSVYWDELERLVEKGNLPLNIAKKRAEEVLAKWRKERGFTAETVSAEGGEE
jgi:hypothetical protein